MNEKAPQGFCSYAHESDALRQSVRELAEYLRESSPEELYESNL